MPLFHNPSPAYCGPDRRADAPSVHFAPAGAAAGEPWFWFRVRRGTYPVKRHCPSALTWKRNISKAA
jgi:hypothetical protein